LDNLGTPLKSNIAQTLDRQSAPWHLPWPLQGYCRSRPLCCGTQPGTARRGVVEVSNTSEVTAHQALGRGSRAHLEMYGIPRSNGCLMRPAHQFAPRFASSAKTFLDPQMSGQRATSKRMDCAQGRVPEHALPSIGLANLAALG
jgi:hypothetical protein